jgi:hypothetical protein
MPIVPSKNADLLSFCTSRTNLWSDSAASIGLSAQQVQLFKDATDAAVAKSEAATLADNAKKSATLASQEAFASLRTTVAACISTIKAYAENAPVPSEVYAKSDLPMPATPSPAPAPGKPMEFVVTLLETGALKLAWKCPNPPGTSGTSYAVERKVAGGPLVFLGNVGSREFTDSTIPSGASGVVYQITAFRSTLRGVPAQFNVNFGVGGDGTAYATVTPVGGAIKMAA